MGENGRENLGAGLLRSGQLCKDSIPPPGQQPVAQRHLPGEGVVHLQPHGHVERLRPRKPALSGDHHTAPREAASCST